MSFKSMKDLSPPLRKDRKPTVVLVLTVIALLLIIVALVTPWWSYHSTTKENGTMTHSYIIYKLRKATLKSVTHLGTVEESKSYSELNASETGVLFIITFGLVLVTLLDIGISIVFIYILFFMKKLNKMIVCKCLIGVSILCFFTVGYFAFKLPDVVSADGMDVSSFSGMKMSGTGTLSRGPSIGWYLVLIAGILSLVAAILVLLTKTK